MIGYAGSHGYHLVSAVEGNPNVPVVQPDGSLFFPANAVRRNPAWTSIDLRTSNGHSEYNSLQAQIQRRLANSFQLQVLVHPGEGDGQHPGGTGGGLGQHLGLSDQSV